MVRKMQVPFGFKRLGMNFYTEKCVYEGVLKEDLAVVAFEGVRGDEVADLRAFMDYILDGDFTLRELYAFWKETGSDVDLGRRKPILHVLKMLRDSIDDYEAFIVAQETGREPPDNAFTRQLKIVEERERKR